MKKFDRADIDRIKGNINIVDFIGKHVDLKKRGKEFIGLCPFHVEKTPSFTVVEDRGFYHCFGCGKNGDVIDFSMEFEAVNFFEAIEFLADMAGVELSKSIDEQKEYIAMKVNESIMHEYEKQGQMEVLKFFKERHFPIALNKVFHVGFAKGEGLGIADKYSEHEDILIETGLLYEKDKSKKERFSRRLIFPIIHSRYPIGFGGRKSVDSQRSKYINSKTSFLYDKSRALFGLSQAKKTIRENKSVYLVEGYTDVMSFWTAGMKNVVACCGTAFTRQQARILAGMAECVYLVYDPDNAGKKAAYKAMLTSLEKGLIPYMVDLEDGDPNKWLISHGPEKLKKKATGGRVFYEYYGEILKGKPIQKKIRFIKDLHEAINLVLDRVTRNVLHQEVTKYFGIPYDEAMSKVINLSKGSIDSQALAGLMDEGVRDYLFTTIKVVDFMEEESIFSYIYDSYNQGKQCSVKDLLGEFPDRKAYIIEALLPPPRLDKQSTARIAQKIYGRTMDSKIKKLNASISKGIKEGKDVSVLEEKFDFLRMQHIVLDTMVIDPPW